MALDFGSGNTSRYFDTPDHADFTITANGTTLGRWWGVLARWQPGRTAGSFWQYMVSTGAAGGSNTVNCYPGEDSTANANEFIFNMPVSSRVVSVTNIDDGEWKLITFGTVWTGTQGTFIKVAESSGTTTTLSVDTSNVFNSPNPPTFGARQSDKNSDRFMEGEIALIFLVEGAAGAPNDDKMQAIRRGVHPFMVYGSRVLFCTELKTAATHADQKDPTKTITAYGSGWATASGIAIQRGTPIYVTRGAGVSGVELAGSINSLSSLTGNFRLVQGMSGSINSLSALSGGLGLAQPVSGAINSLSALSGSLGVGTSLAGSINTISSLTGNIALAQGLTGSIDSISALSGSLSGVGEGEEIPLEGILASVSSTTGNLALQIGMAGQLASVSGTTGTISLALSLVGGMNTVSNLTGTLNVFVPLSGSLSSVSALTGNLLTLLPLSGTITSISGLTGDIDIGLGFSGSIVSTSEMSGVLNVQFALSGELQSNSALAGTLRIVGTSGVTGPVDITVRADAAPLLPSADRIIVVPKDRRRIH